MLLGQDGSELVASVFNRDGLSVGAELAGPAIIEQADTTVWLPPGWATTVLDGGALVMTQREVQK